MKNTNRPQRTSTPRLLSLRGPVREGMSPLVFLLIHWHPTGNVNLQWSLEVVSGLVGPMAMEMRCEGL